MGTTDAVVSCLLSDTMKHSKKLIPILMVLALLTAACAADGDDASVSSTTSTPTTEASETTEPIPTEEPVAPGATDNVDVRSVSITPELTPIADLELADPEEVHVTYAPEVPPTIERSDQRIFEVSLEIIEGICPLDPANDVDTEMWGYRIAGDSEVSCGTPAPVFRGRVGDVARITVTNLATNANPHNIDFHAVTGQGGGAAALTVVPGETATIEARLLYPGAFMYHCAFGDVPKHIAYGMYGMFIVDPEEPLPPVDHEWSVMQSEFYVTEADENGLAVYDPDTVLEENPRYVTFNGRTDALTGDNTLKMKVGERSRIYMVNHGLALNSNWHPIGSQWDVVYPEAATHPINDVIRGSQSTLVVTGGATVTELVGYVPSTIILVDHALGRTFYKGAIGLVEIEGDEVPELFSSTDATAGDTEEAPAEETTTTETETTEAPEEASEVSIPEGAWDPNADFDAFSPIDITVEVGTTVTWTNNDILTHTVTSGISDGAIGTADGIFDSGDLASGESFSYTFEEEGDFDYYCSPHPWMIGKVTVTG